MSEEKISVRTEWVELSGRIYMRNVFDGKAQEWHLTQYIEFPFVKVTQNDLTAQEWIDLVNSAQVQQSKGDIL